MLIKKLHYHYILLFAFSSMFLFFKTFSEPLLSSRNIILKVSIFQVNHPKFDNAEDLTSLTYLNESGCLHTLRQRYAGDLVHTYAGNSLIVIKPKHLLSAYTQQVNTHFTCLCSMDFVLWGCYLFSLKFFFKCWF